VMNGFRIDMQKRIIGTQSEVKLSNPDFSPLKDYREVMGKIKAEGFAVSAAIRQELIIKKGNVAIPTTGFGIELDAQRTVSRNLLPSYKNLDGSQTAIEQGMIGSNPSPEVFADNGIILGAGLAYKLDARLEETLILMSPVFSEPTAFGLTPKVRTVKVAGFFNAGMPEYDMLFSYIPLELAQYFGGYGDAVDYLEIKTPSFRKASFYASRLQRSFPQYQIKDWSSFDPSLYSAIRMEKYIMFVIMMFMYIIASFNLTGNMLKTIAKRKRDLGLLKAIGFEERDLSNLFIYKALILCVGGILMGLVITGILLFLQIRFGLIRLAFSSTDAIVLPVHVQAADVIIVILLSFTITILSAILPLKRLRQIKAIELIRQTI
ncbi:MAG: FtsX-like permease family protein, partial [Candidatus Cloacimonetes bacterium]|nr:FtsX-like permease family protein [Candidatus Cloacimonadota bacterium]